MALLTPQDLSWPLPAMHTVRQKFSGEVLSDVPGTVRAELAKPEIRSRIKAGARIAVAVGSRGIRDLFPVVKTLVEELLAAGARPFILSAMGSHGGGTSEGQRAILAAYGITEEALGVPVCTNVESKRIGTTPGGIPVWFDREALAADMVVPVNRIKLHTDFSGPLQSGLCKMLVIGLGNHVGCSAIHEEDPVFFSRILEEAARVILGRATIGFGVAILENAYDRTCHVEAIPADTLIAREKELCATAAERMASLKIPEIDVLIVEEIGKYISGAGFDPNVIGHSSIRSTYVTPIPHIRSMILLGLDPRSEGNGIGIGLFDVALRSIFDQLKLEDMYANAIASKGMADVKIPVLVDTEEEAIRCVVRGIRGISRDDLKIVKIKNTLELEYIQVSDALLPVVEADDSLSLI